MNNLLASTSTHNPLMIASSEWPSLLESTLLQDDASVLQMLGPVMTDASLAQVRDLARSVGEVAVLGHVSPRVYNLLLTRQDSLGEFLRPLACSFSELMLTPEAISNISRDPVLMDLASACYVGNLISDLRKELAAAYPGKNIPVRGAYWSQIGNCAVWCAARPRQITPAFGRLYMKSLAASTSM